MSRHSTIPYRYLKMPASSRQMMGDLSKVPWWRHQMGWCSALLALCEGNSPITGECPSQKPATRSFDVFVDLRLNKRLSKKLWGWGFETLSRSLWRHCNEMPSPVKMKAIYWKCMVYLQQYTNHHLKSVTYTGRIWFFIMLGNPMFSISSVWDKVVPGRLLWVLL